MKVIAKPSFERDIDKIKNIELKVLLNEKLNQIEKAKTIIQITGLKLLRGYRTHYRIKVESGNVKYRIGVIIRKDTVWLVRCCPRKNIYIEFP